MSRQKAENCDVLIVGAGPTGLTLALLLAQRGVNVIVAERAHEPYPLPRAAHIDHQVVRVFQELGIADEIVATCRHSARYDFLTADGQVLLRLDGADKIAAGGWHSANMIHQPSIERALRRAVAGAQNIASHEGWRLTALDEKADAPFATFETPDGSRDIGARFLVGADGARSAVRDLLGIGIDDLGFEEDWLIVDTIVHDASRLPAINLQICDPARPTTCVLMGEGRHRWEFMLKPGETADELLDEAAIERLLAPWDVKGAVEIERKAVYRFAARIAETWQMGNIVLAGDAAHQMPPFAGQGLCSGVRDAANLAWKLAAIVHGDAGRHILETYQPEREPNVRAIVGLAMMMGRMVCITDPEAASARDTQMLAARAAQGDTAGAAPFPDVPTGLIASGTAGAGSYFPQPVAGRQRLDDLLGAGPWLVTRDASPPIEGIKLASLQEVGAFGQALRHWLDTHNADAALVRPDRYVFGSGSPRELADHYLSLLGPVPSPSLADS
ncbi:bifunctional 3-(3-hydroxy-phenyl)propionate/3-hydroxycinnamic acid hydroxylase [Sphingopyxis fribergensis]